MTLFRPVGKAELKLISDSGYRSFPPRLPEQPVFYPVTNERYASEIAKKWNTNDVNSGFHGYVTKFEIDDAYIAMYDTHIVGRSYHQEYWIPAERLNEFNSHIIGKIEVVREYKINDIDA